MKQNNNKGFLPLIEKFSQAHILVIGDVMLDKFIWGDVTRISPEAPVPVVHVKNETCAPGGAGNAAMNVASLGAKCTIAGLVGEDSAKDVLATLLRAKNINTDCLLTHQKPTIQKVRVMGNSHQLIRYDYEEKSENEKEKEMLDHIKKIIDTVDVVLVSDYAKGTITESLMSELKKLGKKIIVDPKSDRFHFYKGTYIIKPNEKEATEILAKHSLSGHSASVTGIKKTEEEDINEIGRQLLERSNANIVLSRGKEGMSLFETDGTISHLPTRTKEACDVTGAGDTVVATIAVATAIGANLKEATTLANYAAGIKVSKIGTVAVSKIELQNALTEGSTKLKTKEELLEIIPELREKNKKIVFTNGCFDILHIGHTRLLQQAKALGDTLILAIDTDKSVTKSKGEGRPLIPQNQRAEILSALDCVDYLLFFDDTELKQILEEMQPEFIVKGGDYSKETVVGNEIADEYGGKVVIIPLAADISTTSIIEKAKQTTQ